jgi:hypothetical protein
MVFPVRIRVPPLKKVLQMAEKYEGQMVLSGLFVNGMSTAGSRKGFF